MKQVSVAEEVPEEEGRCPPHLAPVEECWPGRVGRMLRMEVTG